jgi:predicted ATPase
MVRGQIGASSYPDDVTRPGRPPVGEVALLFTDVEGSTTKARALGADWGRVLARHNVLLRQAIEASDGWLDFTEGDAVFATFSHPPAAAAAAVAAQRAIRAEPWPVLAGALRVRMGLHVGMLERAEVGYLGLEIHRAARVADAAHGGQLLVTEAASAAVHGVLELDDLGLHRLKDFPAPQHLYCAVIDGVGASDFPPPRTLGVRPTNLPPAGTVVVGRGEELQAVTALVGEHRVVTVTGRGGCGKTTLGLAAAEQLLDGFTGGAWWVPLATVADPALVLPTVAAVVRTDPTGRVPLEEALVARLESAPTLLVLDNMEHLLGAVTGVQTLLHRLPELRVLVTSQVPLGLDRESVFVLGPLELPAAADLFVRTARTASPELTLDGADATAINAICARLDCQPLAVELAAARMSVLTAPQIRDRMSADEDLLRRPASDARLERHRSLAAEVEWSLSLLDPGCTALFARMGTFAAAASVGDLETVSGEHARQVLDALDGLVRFALVQRREDGDRAVRFGLPEALRQLAVRALGRDPDAERWRSAHAEHVRAVFEPTRLRHSCSKVEYAAGRHLDADAALAVAWAIKADPVLACEIAGLWSFRLLADGQARQGRELIALVEANPRATARARAHVRLAAAKDALGLGDPETTVAIADRLLPEMEVVDPDLVPYLLSTRGKARAYLSDMEGAVSDSATATALERAAAPAGWGGSLLDEVDVLAHAGRTDEAFARLDEFAALEAQRPERPTMFARYQHNLRGDVALAAGRYPEAMRIYVLSMRESAADGDTLQVCFDLGGLARALIDNADFAAGLEAAGMARAASVELWGAATFADQIVGAGCLERAESAVGADRAGQLEAAGMAVPAGQRLVRAGELQGTAHARTRRIQRPS